VLGYPGVDDFGGSSAARKWPERCFFEQFNIFERHVLHLDKDADNWLPWRRRIQSCSEAGFANAKRDPSTPLLIEFWA
jgi:hypothetical protein